MIEKRDISSLIPSTPAFSRLSPSPVQTHICAILPDNLPATDGEAFGASSPCVLGDRAPRQPFQPIQNPEVVGTPWFFSTMAAHVLEPAC